MRLHPPIIAIRSASLRNRSWTLREAPDTRRSVTALSVPVWVGSADRYAWIGEHSAWIGGRRDSVGEELGESLAHRPSASGLVTENRGGNASLEMVDGDEADTGVETVK